MSSALLKLAALICLSQQGDGQTACAISGDYEALQGTWRVYAARIALWWLPEKYDEDRVVFVFQGRTLWYGHTTAGDVSKPAPYSLLFDGKRKIIQSRGSAAEEADWKAAYVLKGDELVLKNPLTDPPTWREDECIQTS